MKFCLMLNLFLISCVGNFPLSYGLSNGKLTPCTNEGSCYSSYEEKNSSKWIEAMNVEEPSFIAMKKMEKIILKYGNASIEKKEHSYIKSTFSLFSFVNLPVSIEFYFPEGSRSIMIKAQKVTIIPEMGLIKSLVEKIKFSYYQNDVN